eukprot:4625283-Prorocentrum_lima.AAC.1
MAGCIPLDGRGALSILGREHPRDLRREPKRLWAVEIDDGSIRTARIDAPRSDLSLLGTASD